MVTITHSPPPCSGLHMYCTCTCNMQQSSGLQRRPSITGVREDLREPVGLVRTWERGRLGRPMGWRSGRAGSPSRYETSCAATPFATAFSHRWIGTVAESTLIEALARPAGGDADGGGQTSRAPLREACDARSHLHAARKILRVHGQMNDLHQPERVRTAAPLPGSGSVPAAKEQCCSGYSVEGGPRCSLEKVRRRSRRAVVGVPAHELQGVADALIALVLMVAVSRLVRHLHALSQTSVALADMRPQAFAGQRT